MTNPHPAKEPFRVTVAYRDGNPMMDQVHKELSARLTGPEFEVRRVLVPQGTPADLHVTNPTEANQLVGGDFGREGRRLVISDLTLQPWLNAPDKRLFAETPYHRGGNVEAKEHVAFLKKAIAAVKAQGKVPVLVRRALADHLEFKDALSVATFARTINPERFKLVLSGDDNGGKLADTLKANGIEPANTVLVVDHHYATWLKPNNPTFTADDLQAVRNGVLHACPCCALRSTLPENEEEPDETDGERPKAIRLPIQAPSNRLLSAIDHFEQRARREAQ